MFPIEIDKLVKILIYIRPIVGLIKSGFRLRYSSNTLWLLEVIYITKKNTDDTPLLISVLLDTSMVSGS